MATVDSALSTLNHIRIKVRRLTRSPSTSQLTDQQIDDYINTFVLYDFPEFTVDNKLVFFVMPNVGTYETNTVNADDPLYNFKNRYLSVRRPIYVAGEEIGMSESRTQFFRDYPQVNNQVSVGTGDGATVVYSGTITKTPILANTLSISSVDANGDGIVLKDVPRNSVTTGLQTQVGDLVDPDSAVSVGTINYLTGVYSFTFAVIPGATEAIIAQFYGYAVGRPLDVLFEDRRFTFRPVPDKVYQVQIDAFKRPTELLNSTDEPDIAQWWQYIAYGAAKKVFEDRMDVESIQVIMPELERQRTLVLQRLVVQQSNERVATIYTEGPGHGYNDNNIF